ncbi:MAG: exodeoxyribonuclease VII small subunit [Caldilineaceae bacterium SB0662_bin_9]|uniref:Exodeoxyribonuclease 7 small subunit n=1 Tax=Caldilineaceae bacterium SB0662_bin_9 TaxID=2605258 RepID=A0A6B1DTG4_9CHLR|nr:exodeoxyribonuclease VII small subunit [Caldilineaceae bacterium SB0662_bin_9]
MEHNTESPTEQEQLPFEEAIRRLEQVVKDLESGDKTLDEALALYEEGKKLSALCDRYLQQAELKLKQWDDDASEVVDSYAEDTPI